MKSRQIGVTLIELMIVVAILGFLAAIAYPSYNSYVTRSARSTGQSMLTQVASRQEQFFMDNKFYADDLEMLGFPSDPFTVGSDGQPNGSGQTLYRIEIDTANTSATTYAVRAVPLGTHHARDTECGTLTLNHRGIKGANGTAPQKCW